MRTTRRTLLAGLALAPAMATFPATARARLEPNSSQTALEAALMEHKAPAMAAAVIGRDGVVWSGFGGVRKEGAVDAVTASDLWHMGSNGKAMTAVLYGRLVEKGQAEWGATVAKLFEGETIDPAMASVTIGELLCHRSGLMDRDAMGADIRIAATTDKRPGREQRTDFARTTLAKAPTGQKGAFVYSNVNYVMVGAAIERLLDQPWEDAIKAHVFDPLGMASVGHGAPQGDSPWGHQAMGPRPGPVDPARMADNPVFSGPAGRMHMTVEDYGRFLRVYLNEGAGLITPDSLRVLTTPIADDSGYAYGWGVSNDRPWARGPALSHDGSNTMWHVTATVAPARGLAFFSVSNDRARGQPANRALLQRLIEIHAA